MRRSLFFVHRRSCLLALIICLLTLVAVAVVEVIMLRLMLSEGFPIPIQDCLLSGRSVTGKIIDSDGNPIPNATVQVGAGFAVGFEAGRVDRTVSTDETGRFERITMSVFECDDVQITISAAGFQEISREYSASQGLIESLPEELSIVLSKAP
jgi:hypothetical protein